MSTFNITASRARADRMVRRWGRLAYLRREGMADRAVYAGFIEYGPRERDLIIEGYRRIAISALDPVSRLPLSTPPDFERDMLVFAGDVYRIVTPIYGPRPNGLPIIHYADAQYYGRDPNADLLSLSASFIDASVFSASLFKRMSLAASFADGSEFTVSARLRRSFAASFIDEGVFNAVYANRLSLSAAFSDEATFNALHKMRLRLAAEFEDEGIFDATVQFNTILSLAASFVDDAEFNASMTLPITRFVNAATKEQAQSSNPFTMTLPDNRVNGNLLICFVGVTNANTWTVSSGWTLHQNAATNLLCAYRYVDGTETAATFTRVAGGNHAYSGACLQIANAAQSDPIGAENTQTNTSTTAVNNGITTEEDGSLVIAMLLSGTSNFTGNPDVAWEQAFAVPNGSPYSIRAHTRFFQTAGATGNIAYTQSPSAGYRFNMYEIKGAAV